MNLSTMKEGDVISMNCRGEEKELLVVVVKYSGGQWRFRAVEFFAPTGWVDESRWWRGPCSMARVVRKADEQTTALLYKWKNRKLDASRENELHECRIGDAIRVYLGRGQGIWDCRFQGFTGSGNVKFLLPDGRKGTCTPKNVSRVTLKGEMGGESDGSEEDQGEDRTSW